MMTDDCGEQDQLLKFARPARRSAVAVEMAVDPVGPVPLEAAQLKDGAFPTSLESGEWGRRNSLHRKPPHAGLT